MQDFFIKRVDLMLGTPFAAIRRVSMLDFPAGSASPVMNIDHFWMDKPIFPPHPHAGFVAATFLTEDSLGSVVNRDSLTGGVQTYLEPGGVYWCSAGSGVVHEQIPKDIGTISTGLQVFIDLPAEHKLSPPSVQLITAAAVPRYTNEDGIVLRILAGEASAVNSLVDVNILDVTIPFGAIYKHTLAAGHSSVLIHMLGGSVVAGTSQLNPTDTASITLNPSSSFTVSNIEEFNGEKVTAKFILFTGAPLAQPVVWGGPFLMLSEEQLADRKRSYQAGEMGTLSPSPVEWAKRG